MNVVECDLDEFTHLLGVPFLVGGRTLAGMDCLGVVLAGLSIHGLDVEDPWARVARLWDQGVTVPLLMPAQFVEMSREAELRAGDVLEIPRHVALYVGHGYVLQSLEGAGCVLTPLQRMRRKIKSVWRWHEC